MRRWLRRRKSNKMWDRTAEFAREMRDNGIDKIVITRIPGSDYAELTLFLDGSDEEWVTNEFQEDSLIKKWLRKHFNYL